MPVYFERKKRKNGTPGLVHTLLTGLVMAATGLLSVLVVAGVSGTAVVSAPAVQPDAFRIIIETGAANLKSLDDFRNAWHLPDMPAEDIVFTDEAIVSDADARNIAAKYNARMVIWELVQPDQKSTMITRFTGATPWMSVNPFKDIWLPEVIRLAYTGADEPYVIIPWRIIDVVILYDSGLYERAADALVNVNVLNSITERLFQGSAYFNLGDYAGAIEQYDQALYHGEYPDLMVLAHQNRGNALYMAGDTLAALQDFRAVSSDNPALMNEAMYNRAIAAEELHLYVEAMTQYRLLVKGGQQYRDARVRLMRLDKALADKRAACDSEYGDVSSVVRDSMYYSCIKDFDRALTAAQKMLEEQPTSCWNQVWLGFLNRSMRNSPEARQNFQKAIDLCPNDYYAHLGRGIIAGETGDMATFLDDFAFTSATKDENAALFTAWGGMFARRGQVEQAAQIYYDWMTRPDVPLPKAAVFGRQQQVTLNAGSDDVFMLTVSGKQGKILSVVAAGNDPYSQDTLLVLLDSSGNPVTGDDNNKGDAGDWNAQMDYRLPADGTYTIAVTQFGEHPGTQILVTYSMR